MGTVMHVLRLCSVFESPDTALTSDGVRFDPIGGTQNHTARLSRALDGLGVRQTVVTTRPPTAPAIARLGQHAMVVRLGAPMPVCRQFYCLPAWWWIPGLAEGVDVVHAHLGEDLAIMPLAVRAAACARAPLVVTVHCSLRHTLEVSGVRSLVLKTLGGALEQYGLEHAAVVIALTERLKNLTPHPNVHVIPSGVGNGFNGPRAHVPELSGLPHPLVGYVGRLHAQKGVDILLRAFALLDVAGHLVIAGDGPERRRLQRLAAQLGISARTSFLGFLPAERVPSLIRELDVLVLASRYEELGSVLLEAMYCRTPVVASRVGGIPQVVEHGRTGLLVPPGSPCRLADTLGDLLGDRVLAGTLRENAYQETVGRTWDNLVHQVLDVYHAVMPQAPTFRRRPTRP